MTAIFPFGSRTLQTRPESAFSFQVSEGQRKPSRKNGEVHRKNKQTNNKSVIKYATKPEKWISSRNRILGADVVDIFPLSKFILPELTYYLAYIIKIKGPMR